MKKGEDVWIVQDCREQMDTQRTHSVIRLWLHQLLYLSSSLQEHFLFCFLSEWQFLFLGEFTEERETFIFCVSTWQDQRWPFQNKLKLECLLLISFTALPLSTHVSQEHKVQNICSDFGRLFLHDSLGIKDVKMIFQPLNCPCTLSLQFRGGFVAAWLGRVLVSKCESSQTGLWVRDGVMKALQWSSAMWICVCGEEPG